MSEWETFCDECYYHLWRVRRKNERGFHVQNREDAEVLVATLNGLERERDEAIAARKSSAAEWLGQIEQANARVSRVLQQVALAESERDEAREALSEIAFYLSVGMGDETTTPQQYQTRILEGIKMLVDPIMDLWKQAERERDEARAVVRELWDMAEVYLPELTDEQLDRIHRNGSWKGTP